MLSMRVISALPSRQVPTVYAMRMQAAEPQGPSGPRLGIYCTYRMYNTHLQYRQASTSAANAGPTVLVLEGRWH
jgi:hypothetical protein